MITPIVRGWAFFAFRKEVQHGLWLAGVAVTQADAVGRIREAAYSERLERILRGPPDSDASFGVVLNREPTKELLVEFERRIITEEGVCKHASVVALVVEQTALPGD